MNQSGRLIGDRAFTNPFSNSMILSKSNMGKAFDTFAYLQLPIDCAPQFMHEATHYWCFNSPVGLAISLKYLKIKRRALNNLVQLDTSTRNINFMLNGVCFVESFLEIMRPITEGLALFAENDVVVGNSKIISQTSLLLGMCFSSREDDTANHLDNINTILFQARLKEKQIRQKANLLLQPILCEHGGYLPGYLLIKNFQSILIRNYSKFIDSDLFYHFVKCHFFDDWDLVNIILDETLNIWKKANEITTYLQFRIKSLLTENLADIIEEFESRGLLAKPVTFNYKNGKLDTAYYTFPTFQAIHQDEGMKKMTEIMDFLFMDSSHELISKMVETDRMLFCLRTALIMGHSSFRVVVNEHRRLLIYSDEFMPDKNFPVASFPAPDNIPAGFDKIVQASLLTIMNPPGIYLFLQDDDEIIFSFSYNQKPIPEYLFTNLVDWEKRELLESNSGKLIEKILNEKRYNYKRDLDAFIDRAKKVREKIYNPISLIFTPDEKLVSLNKTMSENGMLNIFEDNLKFITDISALSLCAPFSISPNIAFPNRKWSMGSDTKVREKANELLYKHAHLKAFIGSDVYTLSQL